MVEEPTLVHRGPDDRKNSKTELHSNQCEKHSAKQPALSGYDIYPVAKTTASNFNVNSSRPRENGQTLP